MKDQNKFVFFLIILVCTIIIIYIVGEIINNDSINENKIEPKQNTTLTANITSNQKDTSYYFIKRLLNASPSEVERTLGKPDKKIERSNDCDYLPYCDEANYQSGKFNILYYNNRLKTIFVNNVNGIQWNENAIEAINFPKINPTVSTDFDLRWENYEGIKLIGFFPGKEEMVGSISICVKASYGKKFGTEDENSMNESPVENAKAEIENEDKNERLKNIQNQFSAWDGAHFELERIIKQNMNNPDSYKHVQTTYLDKGSYLIIMTKFRGTNAFGAIVMNEAKGIVKLNKDGKAISISYSFL